MPNLYCYHAMVQQKGYSGPDRRQYLDHSTGNMMKGSDSVASIKRHKILFALLTTTTSMYDKPLKVVDQHTYLEVVATA